MNFEVRITFPWIGLHIEEGEVILQQYFVVFFITCSFSLLPVIYCILLFVISYVNPFTINLCRARVKNLVFIIVVLILFIEEGGV